MMEPVSSETAGARAHESRKSSGVKLASRNRPTHQVSDRTRQQQGFDRLFFNTMRKLVARASIGALSALERIGCRAGKLLGRILRARASTLVRLPDRTLCAIELVLRGIGRGPSRVARLIGGLSRGGRAAISGISSARREILKTGLEIVGCH